MLSSTLPNNAAVDPDHILPSVYRNHPSRPIPFSLANLPDTEQVPKRIAVVVALLSPISIEDEKRILDLQDVRKRWDQAYPRWLPHMTLIPPFTIPSQSPVKNPEEDLKDISDAERENTHEIPSRGLIGGGTEVDAADRSGNSDYPAQQSGASQRSRKDYVASREVKDALDNIGNTLSEVCSRFSQHKISLDDVGTFKLRGYTNVHLRPRPIDASVNGLNTDASHGIELVRLQAALVHALPQEVLAGRKDGHKSHGRPPTFSRAQPKENRSARRLRERAEAEHKVGIQEVTTQENPISIVDGPKSSVHNRSGKLDEDKSTRVFTRPMYRSGLVDEARCITLPTLNVDESYTRHTVADSKLSDVEDNRLAEMKPMDEARSIAAIGRPPNGRSVDESGQLLQPLPSTSHSPTASSTRSKAATRSSDRESFKPHASVGQARGVKECDRLVKIAKALLEGKSGTASTVGHGEKQDGRGAGIECWIDKVYLLTKPAGNGGPYELHSVASLEPLKAEGL